METKRLSILISTICVLAVLLILGRLILRASAQTRAAPYSGPLQAAGSIQITNGTSGSATLSTALAAGSICAGGPITDLTKLPGLGWVVTNTSTLVTVTLSQSGTGTFWFMCYTRYP